MGKKILVVTEEKEKNSVAEMIVRSLALDPHDFEFCICSHIGANAIFEEEKPNIVIVCDYTTKGSLVKGFQSYNDIKKLAKSWQTGIRIGQEKCDHPDHIMYPTKEVPMAKGEERFRKSLRCLFAA